LNEYNRSKTQNRGTRVSPVHDGLNAKEMSQDFIDRNINDSGR